MIKLNDYIYSGDTVINILQKYTKDLKKSAKKTNNEIDIIHCEFLLQVTELLHNNDFLKSQYQRIREFYKFMENRYPFLAFTFKGRIKSLLRAEEKFNGYIVEYIYDYYKEHGNYPSLSDLKNSLSCFRDLIAYRIVVSLPIHHLKTGENQADEEIDYIYDIANNLLEFLEERGFTPELSSSVGDKISPMLKNSVSPYYRDYITNPEPSGYRSLHITFYDNVANCYIELQIRTKDMDDFAEIGPANHLDYEKRQEKERTRRKAIPIGECSYFDEAYERVTLLQQLELSKVEVNMFSAIDNSLINDSCGFYIGRQIVPYEHLSEFQNDLVN